MKEVSSLTTFPSMAQEGDNSLTEMVLKDLNMTEEDLENGVKHLRDWISKQPHLPVHPGENFLKSFIIGSKSLDKSKTKLDSYYTYKGKYDYHQNRDPMKIQWDSVSYCIHLPQLTPKGFKVMYYDLPKDCSDYQYHQSAQLISMEIDLMLRDNPMIAGHACICNVGNLSLAIFKAISFVLTGQLIKMYQSIYPIRFKGIFFLNGSSLLQTLLNLVVKPFCSQKFKEKIFVCADLEDLKKHIPLEMLPKELGGSAPSLDVLKAEFRNKLESERDWLLSEGAEKSDESKR